MKTESVNGGLRVSGFGGINLKETLFCGQAFRWNEAEKNVFTGVVRGTAVKITQESCDSLFFAGISEKVFGDIFVDYFDFRRDYGAVINEISKDGTVAAALEGTGIIHILNQEPWECLCSFIISQCNNIPRIRSIIKTLCDNFGGETGTDMRSFPPAEKVASLTENDLAVLHAGYRAPYILNAARAVASGETDLEGLKTVSPQDAEKALMSIRGVGKKVADCAMLYSLGFFDTYPVDRHIARADAQLYPGGLPPCFNGAKGLAQQYIFIRQRQSAAAIK